MENVEDDMMDQIINGFENLPHEVVGTLRHLAEQASKSECGYRRMAQRSEAVVRLCRRWTREISQANDSRHALSYAHLKLSVVNTLLNWNWKKLRARHMWN